MTEPRKRAFDLIANVVCTVALVVMFIAIEVDDEEPEEAVEVFLLPCVKGLTALAILMGVEP